MITAKMKWMIGLTVLVAAGAAAALPPPPPPAPPPPPRDTVTVTVEGKGYDKLSAVNDAFRKAIEQVAGAELWSETAVKDFVVEKDVIVSRSKGYVKEHTIIKEEIRRLPTGVIVVVTCRCVVRLKELKDDWGGVQMVLKQVGRPKIMVMITDRVDGMLRDESYTQTEIQDQLIRSGFELVSKEGLAALDQKRLMDARLKDDVAAIQELAQRFKAQAYVVGSVKALFQREGFAGIPIYWHAISANIKVYETNTGNLMGAMAYPNKVHGDRGTRETAADSGLKKVASLFAPGLKYRIIQYWFAMVDPRRGQDILLEVSNTTFSTHRALLQALTAVKEFKEVNGEFGSGASKFTIKSVVNVNEAATKIDDIRLGVPAQYKVEITAMRGNRIVAEYKQATP
jgi:hypothetical protein